VLSTVYGWFTDGVERQDLRDAKAVLDEVGCRIAFAPPVNPE
jgi:hypothetical protein